MGEHLAILGHHYQSDAVIRHCDLRGDSLELARRIEDLDAEHIVFCGVSFMGESAAILTAPGQHVHMPAPDASCTMAQMAQAPTLERILGELNAEGRRVLPLAYVNTSLAIKAVVGRFGGAVCTSANAQLMLSWALARADAVLFLPDRNLAANTADALDIPEAERHVLDIRGRGRRLDRTAAHAARLLVWPGCCSIHHTMCAEDVARARAEHPGCTVAVHPECRPEVVRAADGAGSTTFLIAVAEDTAPGETLVIGTEINLVRRLAALYPDKTIVPLRVSACGNMAKVTEAKLAETLENLENAEPVRVDPALAAPARDALTRMLEACER